MGTSGSDPENKLGGKRPQGFAAWTPEKRREAASKGGCAARDNGTAHRWNGETARVAGRKGGQASQGGRRQVLEGQE